MANLEAKASNPSKNYLAYVQVCSSYTFFLPSFSANPDAFIPSSFVRRKTTHREKHIDRARYRTSRAGSTKPQLRDLGHPHLRLAQWVTLDTCPGNALYTLLAKGIATRSKDVTALEIPARGLHSLLRVFLVRVLRQTIGSRVWTIGEPCDADQCLREGLRPGRWRELTSLMVIQE